MADRMTGGGDGRSRRRNFLQMTNYDQVIFNMAIRKNVKFYLSSHRLFLFRFPSPTACLGASSDHCFYRPLLVRSVPVSQYPTRCHFLFKMREANIIESQ